MFNQILFEIIDELKGGSSMIEYAKFLALFFDGLDFFFYIIKNYFSNITLTCLNLRERERVHNMLFTNQIPHDLRTQFRDLASHLIFKNFFLTLH